MQVTSRPRIKYGCHPAIMCCMHNSQRNMTVLTSCWYWNAVSGYYNGKDSTRQSLLPGSKLIQDETLGGCNHHVITSSDTLSDLHRECVQALVSLSLFLSVEFQELSFWIGSILRRNHYGDTVNKPCCKCKCTCLRLSARSPKVCLDWMQGKCDVRYIVSVARGDLNPSASVCLEIRLFCWCVVFVFGQMGKNFVHWRTEKVMRKYNALFSWSTATFRRTACAGVLCIMYSFTLRHLCICTS